MAARLAFAKSKASSGPSHDTDWLLLAGLDGLVLYRRDVGSYTARGGYVTGQELKAKVYIGRSCALIFGLSKLGLRTSVVFLYELAVNT